jgi:hypothetical protein
VIKKDAIEREILLQYLTQGVCKVYFNKVTNGRFRSLYCTLIPSIIPLTVRGGLNNIFSPMLPDLDLLPVYDVLDNSWKSFRLRNVIYFYTTKDLHESATENRKVKQIESRI